MSPNIGEKPGGDPVMFCGFVDGLMMLLLEWRRWFGVVLQSAFCSLLFAGFSLDGLTIGYCLIGQINPWQADSHHQTV